MVSTCASDVGNPWSRVFLDQTKSPLTNTSKFSVTLGSLISSTEIWSLKAPSNCLLSWWDFGSYPHPPQYWIWTSTRPFLGIVVIGRRRNSFSRIALMMVSTCASVLGNPWFRVLLDQIKSSLTKTSKLPVVPLSLISLIVKRPSRASSNCFTSLRDFGPYPHPPQYWIRMSNCAR